MSAANWIALAASVSTSAIAVTALIVTYRTARRLARDERLFQVRSSAYLDALQSMTLRERQVHRAHPVAGTHEPLPDSPPHEEMARIDALLGAFGSTEVRAGAKDFGDAVIRFRYELGTYENLIQQRAIPAAQDAQRERLEARREEVRAKLLEVERVIQADLNAE